MESTDRRLLSHRVSVIGGAARAFAVVLGARAVGHVGKLLDERGHRLVALLDHLLARARPLPRRLARLRAHRLQLALVQNKLKKKLTLMLS